MTQQDSITRMREGRLFARREDGQPHISYATEKLGHQVIRDGRVDQIETILNLPVTGTSGVLSTDAVRNGKNMFIAAITSFTRAAMDGGLPEELAYAMSDSYIMASEASKDGEEIHELYVRAFREFTEAVAKEKGRRYSARTESVIHYIQIHLHENISLADAAAAAGISPCHLSRAFRAETGQSIVDFIQQERIKAAKNMLIYSDATLAAISQYLAFSTQSYFIKIFKKYEGITPGEYRRQYQASSW